MSILADIVAALGGVAGDSVFTDTAPQDYKVPLVIIVRNSREPLPILTGSSGYAKYVFVFECYGKTKAAAIALADTVRAAILAAAATTLTTQYEENVATDQYEQQLDEYMEPVSFSFWAP